MLGSLTRWLRLLGYEAEYYKDASDDFLLTKISSERQILLTRDVELVKRVTARGRQAFLVEGEDEAERLSNIASKITIKLEVDEILSRCPICGFVLKKAGIDEVRNKVSKGTFKHYNEFWVCPNCNKAYWRGSHWKKINETLRRAKELLKTKY